MINNKYIRNITNNKYIINTINNKYIINIKYIIEIFV